MKDKLIPWVILLLLAIIVYESQERWWPYVVQWWSWLSGHGDGVGLLDSLLAIIGTIVTVMMAYFAFFGRSNEGDEDNEPDEPDEGEGNGNGVSVPATNTTPVTVNLQLDGIVNEVRSRISRAAAPNPHHAPALRPEPEDVEKARACYLDLLAQRCNVLPLAALGGQEGMGEEVKLDEVYVALDTTSRVPLTEQQQDQYRRNRTDDRALTAMEVATEQRRLVLLGDPGSGKSTFVRQLVASVARACDQGQAFSEGWQAGLLPVLVVLRDLAPRLEALALDGSTEETRQALLAAVWAQWRADLKRLGAEDFEEGLRETLQDGSVLGCSF